MDNRAAGPQAVTIAGMSWTAVASGQAGLITRAQLVYGGVPSGTVDLWLARGRLEATRAQGVYRVGGAPDTPQRAAWFAVLASRSPISFLSAGVWWDMPVEPDGLVHITRFDRRRLDWPAGVRVHRVRLDRTDSTAHRGLPITTRAETVLDCIGWISPGRALILADRATQQGWLRDRDVRHRLEDQPKRWGNRQIRRTVVQLAVGADAESERRLHRLLRAAGLREWVPQYSVVVGPRRFRIDVAFPDRRLAIEVDGYTYHSADARFQQDRTKQNALTALGWRILRFTWADIVDRPEYVMAQITSLLAA